LYFLIICTLFWFLDPSLIQPTLLEKLKTLKPYLKISAKRDKELEVLNRKHEKVGDCTGTCFIKKIYAPSSSLLQGKHLPFSPSPLCLNIFRLFVILSLTQLYRYTPEIFLFSTATFKYTPSDKLDKNSQRTWLIKNFSQ
jgi:hypothetical protein